MVLIVVFWPEVFQWLPVLQTECLMLNYHLFAKNLRLDLCFRQLLAFESWILFEHRNFHLESFDLRFLRNRWRTAISRHYYSKDFIVHNSNNPYLIVNIWVSLSKIINRWPLLRSKHEGPQYSLTIERNQLTFLWEAQPHQVCWSTNWEFRIN